MGDAGDKPNILMVVVDEMRAPMVYENLKLRRFREAECPAVERLKRNGVSFEKHYTSSCACVPSRGVMYTGQYPSLTKVKFTSGGAKDSTDPNLKWLEPGAVPTMGDWFRAAGYDSQYVGKWHLSWEDLLDDEKETFMFPYNAYGKNRVNEEALSAYERAKVLEKYGWGGTWIGPEPHGAKKDNCGWFRDPYFVDQAKGVLDRKEREQAAGTGDPFMMAVNLVNPHDIVFANQVWFFWHMFESHPDFNGKGYGEFNKFKSVPRVPPAPSEHENLKTKPTPQQEFVKLYKELFTTPLDKFVVTSAKYRQFYYFLMAVVDRQVDRLLAHLESLPTLKENTIVVLTSDHGELLGSHGGQRQKWHTVYEETLRVPFIVQMPPSIRADTASSVVRHVSCSADLLPTLLGLAGIDQDATLGKLSKTHSEAHPLPGRDWSEALLAADPSVLDPAHDVAEPLPQLVDVRVSDKHADRGSSTVQVDSVGQIEETGAILIQMADNISRGSSQLRTVAKVASGLQKLRDMSYDSVQGPPTIHAVVATVNFVGSDGRTATGTIKYARYWDDPEDWSEPFVRDVYKVRKKVKHPITGEKVTKGGKIVRTEQIAEEEELYVLEHDPHEMTNLGFQKAKTRRRSSSSPRDQELNLVLPDAASSEPITVCVTRSVLLDAMRSILKEQVDKKTRERRTPYEYEIRTVHPKDEWKMPSHMRPIIASVVLTVLTLALVAVAVVIGVPILLVRKNF